MAGRRILGLDACTSMQKCPASPPAGCACRHSAHKHAVRSARHTASNWRSCQTQGIGAQPCMSALLSAPACCACQHSPHKHAVQSAKHTARHQRSYQTRNTAAQPCTSALLAHQHAEPASTHPTSMLCSQPYTLQAINPVGSRIADSLTAMHNCPASPSECCACRHSPTSMLCSQPCTLPAFGALTKHTT